MQKVSHDAHPEFLNNIRTITLLSIVEDVRVGIVVNSVSQFLMLLTLWGQETAK